MADATDTRALLLTIQANTELLRSNLTQAERAVQEFTAKTQQHLDSSDARFEFFGHSIERLEGPLEHLKRVGETAFAFMLGESLIEKGKQALEFAGNIEFASQKIGVSTTFLQQFRYAASQSGATILDTDAALTKFSRSIGEAANGNKKVIELFNRLGVQVLDSGGKVRSVEAIFKETSTAISKIPDPAQRTADTLTLMGRGASNLIPLMARGAQGFNELADAADHLGIVLSPELIEHAEEVNHKLAGLKLILDAQMASAVASNASSIEGLANSLISLTSAILKFQSAHPEVAFAMLGAAGGSRFGPWGAAIGAVAGEAAGHFARQNADEQNMDPRFRAQRLREAKASYDLLARDPNYRRGVANPTIDHARDELVHQMDLTKQAIALSKSPKKPEGGLGSDEAGDSNPDISHHKKGKSAEQLAREAEAKRQRALAEDSAFDRELRSAQVAYQHAEAALADTAQNQLRAELASLQDALITRRDEIDNQLSAGKISKVRRDQLVAILDATEADQEELARRKEQARLLSEKLAHDQLEVQGQVEMLGLDERLAYTRKERLKIELKILELQEEQALREQQKIIDDPTSTAAQRQDAQTRQGQVKDQYGKAQEDTRRQNASPIDSYKDQLKRDVGDMNDALQSVEVDGIKGIQDGLIGIINGTESVGSAFKKMADQIIADLIRIAAEKLILSVLDNIAGLAGGGSVGDGSHDISNGAKGFADGGIPGYAGGARVIKGAGSGTSDSILALLGGRKLIRVSNGESINTAESTRRNWALIDAMNQGPLPGFASGGMPSAPRAPSLPNIAGMGGGGAIQFNMPISINAPGADPAALKRVEDSVDQLRSEVPATAIQAVAEAKSRFMFRDGL
ncbi:hypothetical protein U1839_06065 [Sphingomonas sp. RT2P30]|uniref:hypothetical protein n=1 Tax=Parasphingomonas halimpatiens TaxID=3096162 RepID=UPI002FCA621A